MKDDGQYLAKQECCTGPWAVIYIDADTGKRLIWGYSEMRNGGAAMYTARLCPWAKNPTVVNYVGPRV